MKDTTLLETTELAVMASGGWGTINARSVSAAAALATYVGAKHALLCHSYDAAYESLIRHFGAAHGDRIAVGELCEPTDAIVPVCVGAMPAFTPNCPSCGMIAPDALNTLLAEIENGGAAYRRQAGNFGGFTMRTSPFASLCLCYLCNLFCCGGRFFFCC